jgi:hypothetical protein
VILKAGVVMNGVQPQIWYAIGMAEAVYLEHGHALVVTCLKEGHQDRPHSLHHTGMAVDFRIRDMGIATVALIQQQLKTALAPLGYDVVLESDHIHVEYDPKLVETWFTLRA